MHGIHFGYLDGWRGLAIVLLLIGHFLPVPGINFGAVGVNLFFVLSGWLMCRLLFEQQMAIGVFYRRRVARIFPAHYVFLGLVVLWFLVSGHRVDWAEVAAAVGFVINYGPVRFGDATMPFGHIWSLCVEEHSYLLLSLVAVASRKGWVHPLRVMAMLSAMFALVGIVYWLRYAGRELDFSKWLHSEVSAYGIFLSAWLLLLFRARGTPKVSSYAAPALLALGVAAHWWSIAQPVRTIVGVGAFALAVNLLPTATPRLRHALELPVLRALGVWSFSIYLWQQPFYLWAADGAMPTWLALPAAILAGIASFHLVENPLRRHLNRVWGRAEGGSVLPAGRPAA
jgi:peptidoglycan/LPS O-acetylase OafA/YrhL